MYKIEKEPQISLTDFGQALGVKLNPNNRWVKKAAMIPWDKLEEEYAQQFSDLTGAPAKPLRAALGSLLIQKQLKFSDRELVEEIRENPYFQYFIGMSEYTDEEPYAASLLVEFRKRLDETTLTKINEQIIEYNLKSENDNDNSDDDNSDDGNSDTPDKSINESDSENDDSGEKNKGTLIIDATCAPQNIRYPQDVSLLNEAREKLEGIILHICDKFYYYAPRMYREKARKDYLNFAKSKKRSGKKVRNAIKKQLQYVRRDLGYIGEFLSYEDVEVTQKEAETISVINKVYEQQLYMYENKVHSVEDRIVSISQPYIRPIVRGKVKSPVEFGAKLDLSVDEHGMARLEKLSFDAYNEAEVLKTAAENYRKRTGHYPERILADQIYRNKDNINFCKSRGIRLLGKPLGRPKKEPDVDKKTEYRDGIDRIEVERRFSLSKRKFGLGLIMTKLESTTKSSVWLSIIAMNLDRLAAAFLRFFYRAIFMPFSDIYCLYCYQ